MRDEIDGRIWSANHEAFDRMADRAISKVRSALSRLGSWDGSTTHLLALVAAFAMTTLTFNATT